MTRGARDCRRQTVSTLLMLVGVAWALALTGTALAQPAGGTARLPADPWPREVTVPGATLLVYQPQVSSWQGNALALRAVIAVRRGAGKQETFGVVWATARTQVDRVSRIAALDDFTITKSDFPTLPDQTTPAATTRDQVTVARCPAERFAL